MVFHYPNRLSASVLQGFTCSSVNKMSTKKIKRLIHASRPRRGRAKVQLRESQVSSNEIYLKLILILHLDGPLSKAANSEECHCIFLDHFLQLTCMYNLLSGNLSQNFTDYPSDMLLYFKWVSAFSCNDPITLLWLIKTKNMHLLYDFPHFNVSYHSNKDVKRGNCRSYFSALGTADFSVASSILNKDSILLSEARTCLVSTLNRVCH